MIRLGEIDHIRVGTGRGHIRIRDDQLRSYLHRDKSGGLLD